MEVNKADFNTRIDVLLSQKISSLSRNRIQTLITEKSIFFNSKIILEQTFKLKLEGEIKIIIPDNKKIDLKPQKIELNIIYEDKDLIVINKPAGMVVHPAATGNYSNTVVNALLYHCKESLSGIGGFERPGIVHRLDKMTSGIMVIAKNDETHQNLSSQFQNRLVEKTYRAITLNRLIDKEGEIKKNIIRSKIDRKKMTVCKTEFGKEAWTSYFLNNSFIINKGLILNDINCKIHTGRTHQIRVHMNSQNNPLLGDVIYGKKINIKNKIIDKHLIEIVENDWYLKNRHALHASFISFKHPSKEKKIHFNCPLPGDFKRILEYLKKNYDYLE